jgi:hypothetical protein
MKKTNFLKIALTLVMAFVMTGAWAQGTDLDGDGANLATSYEASAAGVTGTTHMIAGTTVPLFAMPDPYYHSSYNPATETYTLTAGFLWNWSVTGAVGAGTAVGDITFNQNGVNDNYVEISGGVAGGTYTINVQEESPAAMGGCSDAGENIDVIVHATPAVTMGGNATYEDCPGGAFPAAVTATISGGWQNYRVIWTLQIHTLNNVGAIDFYYDDEAGTNPAAGAKFATGAGFNAASPDNSLVLGANDITTVGSYDVIANKSTVYTYVLSGINDQALRYADFIGFAGDYAAPAADDFTYNPVAETITIRVNPAPNTGPIYHINSNWAL